MRNGAVLPWSTWKKKKIGLRRDLSSATCSTVCRLEFPSPPPKKKIEDSGCSCVCQITFGLEEHHQFIEAYIVHNFLTAALHRGLPAFSELLRKSIDRTSRNGYDRDETRLSLRLHVPLEQIQKRTVHKAFSS